MLEFANKTQFVFDPSPSSVVVTSTGAGKYETSQEFSDSLGDLARLKFIKADLAIKVQLSASDTGTFTVKLSDGTTTYASQQIAITAGTSGRAVINDIDLSSLKGSAKLKVVLDCDSATASATAQLIAKLSVSHPLIIAA